MDNTFDQSEPLHWLAESTGDDEDLQRFIESLDDSLDKDKPQLLSTFNNEEEGEVPLALSDYAVEDPDPVSVHCQSFVPSDPLDCSGCILLREVVHSNGNFLIAACSRRPINSKYQFFFGPTVLTQKKIAGCNLFRF